MKISMRKVNNHHEILFTKGSILEVTILRPWVILSKAKLKVEICWLKMLIKIKEPI